MSTAEAPEPTSRDHSVLRVRAGRSFRGPWPNTRSTAVAISFDNDHETAWLNSGDSSPRGLSEAEYGVRRGMPRILSLLQEYSVPATFFVPGHAAELHPHDIERIVAGGHEVALHGWSHERPSTLTPERERELLHRSIEFFRIRFGVDVKGLRTPSWDVSPSTLPLAVEAGLAYDSSLMADDDPYELLLEGAIAPLIEVPVNWIRDDAVYFLMDRDSGLRPHLSPDDVSAVWLAELRGAHAEGGLFQLTLHPDIIGHRSRIGVLEQVLAAASDLAVWFATHEAVAQSAAESLHGGHQTSG